MNADAEVKVHDHVKHTICHVHWRVAIEYEHLGKNYTVQGRTQDLSLQDANILIDQSISTDKTVKMYLGIPPLRATESETIIAIHCRIIGNVFESSHQQFRIGLRFLKFEENGRELLTTGLEEHGTKLV